MSPESIVATPLWWEASRPPSLSVRAVPATCDVAVIGGGIAGLTAALELAQAGRSVQLFDRRRPGAGAATQNAGIASAMLPMGYSRLVARLGEDAAQTLLKEAHEAQQALVELLRASSIQCEYQPGGAVFPAANAAQMDSLAREARFCEQTLGIEAFTVMGAELANELGAQGYTGALVRADAGTLQPARLHSALLGMAMGAGVQVHGETAVTRLLPSGSRRSPGAATLQTMRGRTLARDVIVTSDGYTDRSDKWVWRRVLPVPLRILTTEALPGEVLSRLFPSGRVMIEAARLRHVARATPDGARLLFGGFCRHGGAPTAVAAEALRVQMLERFPELDHYAVTHSWAALAGFHRDGLPKLYTRANVHYLQGFGGMGLVLSQWLAKKAAWRILEDDRAQTAFSAPGSGAWPPGSRRRWFLPALSAWLRSRQHH